MHATSIWNWKELHVWNQIKEADQVRPVYKIIEFCIFKEVERIIHDQWQMSLAEPVDDKWRTDGLI